MKNKIYTYILKDKVNGIYKIGKSINPRQRFRKLCVPGKIVPVHVIHDDVEKQLHETYAEERLKDHPDVTVKDGHTEWFRYGGKLKPFIDALQIQSIAFYTPHNLYDYLEKEDKLRIPELAVSKYLQEDAYYQYNIGKRILGILGYLFYTGVGYDTIHKGVALKGPKTFLTDDIMCEIASKYTVEVVANRRDISIAKMSKLYGKRLYVRKMGSLEDATPIYIVIAEV